MTIKFINKVDPNSIEDLRNWCRERIQDMSQDVSRYAPGRMRMWIFAECDLRTNAKIYPAYTDNRIEKFAQRVFPGCDIALLTYNGKIDWHRDHNYATTIARGVNLGTAKFGIGLPNNREVIDLQDGDIYEFNCKLPHAILWHSQERFSLTFWKMRSEYKQQLS
ncbi:hypothetical protein QUA51_09750 [Microcoleus sp. Pol10_D6]|uniref:hypothetical protein n=1 Tax=Microcoleus sp. Pol10_D6 TaxID=2818875 RepID=UPI002FD30198